MEKFVPCDICKDSSVEGHILSRGKNHETTIKPCKCYTKWQLKNLLPFRLAKAGLPPSFEFSIEDYIGENSKDNIKKLKEYAHNFKEYSEKSLYFFGEPRTQKTTVAFSVARILLENPIDVCYMVTMDKLTNLLSTFSNQRTGEEQSLIDYALNSDFLIIDECFAKKYANISDHQLGGLREFLKERLEVKRKATLFISNFSPTEIHKKGFTISLQDLIVRNITGGLLLFKDNVNQVKDDFDLDLLWK